VETNVTLKELWLRLGSQLGPAGVEREEGGSRRVEREDAQGMLSQEK
jgi:hypothetical protein